MKLKNLAQTLIVQRQDWWPERIKGLAKATQRQEWKQVEGNAFCP